MALLRVTVGSNRGFGVFGLPHTALVGLVMSGPGSVYLPHGGPHSPWEGRAGATEAIGYFINKTWFLTLTPADPPQTIKPESPSPSG